MLSRRDSTLGLQSRCSRRHKLGCCTLPAFTRRRKKCCDAFQKRIRRRFPKLRFHTLQLPRKCFLVAEKVQSLIRLISSGYIKKSGITGAFFFGEQKCSIRRTQQPVGAGDHIKLIVRLLLSGAMDKKQTDAIAIRQRLQASDDLIIVGVAIVMAKSTGRTMTNGVITTRNTTKRPATGKSRPSSSATQWWRLSKTG